MISPNRNIYIGHAPIYDVVRTAVVMGLFAVAHVSFVSADRIEFLDGRSIEGEIIFQDETSVLIHDGTADLRIPRSLLARITEGNAADRWIVQAQSSLQLGRNEQAIQHLAEAVRGGADPESIAAILIRNTVQISETIPHLRARGLRDLGQCVEAISALEPADAGPYLYTNLRFALELEQDASARKFLRRLRESDPRLYTFHQDVLIERFDRNVDRALGNRNFGRALDLLVELQHMAPARAGDKKTLLLLQWARNERDQGNYDAAFEIYARSLMHQSPRIAHNRILDALEEAERHYRSSSDLAAAIDFYERYGLEHRPEESRRALRQLWNDKGDQELAAGRIDFARQAFAKLDEYSPTMALRGFAQCEYLRRERILDEGDAMGHYILAEWCLEHDLEKEARELFEVASEADALRANAWAQVRAIDHNLNEVELQSLVSLYEEGKYYSVLEGLAKFNERAHSGGIRKQAIGLAELTREAISISVSARPQQAEVLWQQAERAFYSGDHEKAYSMLRALSDRYSDTPAGVRGQQFLIKIRPQLILSDIERGRHRRRYAATESAPPSTPLGDEIQRLRAQISGDEITLPESRDEEDHE